MQPQTGTAVKHALYKKMQHANCAWQVTTSRCSSMGSRGMILVAGGVVACTNGSENKLAITVALVKSVRVPIAFLELQKNQPKRVTNQQPKTSTPTPIWQNSSYTGIVRKLPYASSSAQSFEPFWSHLAEWPNVGSWLACARPTAKGPSIIENPEIEVADPSVEVKPPRAGEFFGYHENVSKKDRGVVRLS